MQAAALRRRPVPSEWRGLGVQGLHSRGPVQEQAVRGHCNRGHGQPLCIVPTERRACALFKVPGANVQTLHGQQRSALLRVQPALRPGLLYQEGLGELPALLR